MSPQTVIDQVTDAELNVLWRLANGIAKSQRFKDVRTAGDAFARIMVGRDLGLTPTDSVAHITFIDESPVIAAEVQAALLRNFVGPDGERYDYDVVTPASARETECHIKIKRREAGQPGWKTRGVEIFTLADAERAELSDNDYWRKWPRRMLFARAISAGIAMYAPEAVHPQLSVGLIPDLVEQVAGDSEVAADDPLRADDIVFDRVEDPDRISQPMVQHVRRLHDQLVERGEEQRFLDTLAVVGAPEHEDLIQRVLGLNENQGAELLARLGPSPAQIRKRHERKAREVARV